MKLVTSEQMKMIDNKTITMYGIPSLLLMEQAAQAIYRELIKQVNHNTNILVVCGSGNNGGDGFALARLLFEEGYQVKVSFIGSEEHMSEDCNVNFLRCKELNVKFVDSIDQNDIIVDALFGTGLTRDIIGEYEKVITEINNMDVHSVSIDIPSGIHADDGLIMGCAIKADETYTIQTGKVGLYLYPGKECAGKISVLDIGIPQELIEKYGSEVYLIEKENMKVYLPNRQMQTNKGSYGKVLCVGGSDSMSGAISLAALAALRVGCGTMTCAIPKSIHTIVAQNVLESMQLILEDEDGHISKDACEVLQQNLDNYTCILVGCGIGRSGDVKEIVSLLLASTKPLLVDADALFVLKDLLVDRKDLILTPHLKEFARLIDVDIKEVIKQPLHYALQFSERYPNVTLVLKSETSFVVKNEVVYINTYGNNGLAKGGSGDVLAGVIIGLFAQCKDSLQASVLGVFLHAYSADILLKKQSVYSIMPSDIIKQIDQTILDLEGRE